MNLRDFLTDAFAVVVGLSLLMPPLAKAGQEYSPDYTFEADAGGMVNDLHEVWYTGVYLAGRGAGSHPIYNNDSGVPNPYTMEKWEGEVGLRRTFRIDINFYYISIGSNSIERIADLIERVLNAGGVPVVVLRTMPDSISSCPMTEDGCPGRPTYPPSDYQAWEDLVYDTIKYLSAEGVLVTNSLLNLKNKPSRGLGNLYYHIWDEPNTNSLSLGGQPGEFDAPTDYWQGTREDFQQLYLSSVTAVERAEGDFGLHLKVGGCDFQRVEQFLWQVWENDPQNWVVDFIQFCHENELRIDFFSWTRKSNNPNFDDENHVASSWRKLLDEYGYVDTELILTELSSQIHVFSENSIGNFIPVEWDSEILASLMPAVFLREEENGLISKIIMEAIQDWNISDENRDYGLFRGGLGQAFTLSNVIKPAYNTFLMLSYLRDKRLNVSKTKEAPDGLQDPSQEYPEYVDCVATLDPQTGDIALLVWVYLNPDVLMGEIGSRLTYEQLLGLLPPPAEVVVQIKELSFSDRYIIHRYKLDSETSNSWSVREEINDALNMGISADEINNWPEVSLQEVETREVGAATQLGLRLLMRPFSVHLIYLEKVDGYSDMGSEETRNGVNGFEDFVQSSNYPNPFGRTTNITFQVSNREEKPDPSRTLPSSNSDASLAMEGNGMVPFSLQIFDLRGRLVRNLLSEEVESGSESTITWDARDDSGEKVACGLYFYKIKIPNRTVVKKIVYSGTS